MVTIEINQTLIPRRVQLRKTWVVRLIAVIAHELRLHGTKTLSIAFVDHLTMRRLNRAYRGKNKVTDILSFSEVGEPKSLGELLLAWPYIRDQAKTKGTSLEEECALLITHGMLHLRGYDHETEADADTMFPLQEKILEKFFKQYGKISSKPES